jgi:hypothetical protein
MEAMIRERSEAVRLDYYSALPSPAGVKICVVCPAVLRNTLQFVNQYRLCFLLGFFCTRQAVTNGPRKLQDYELHGEYQWSSNA